MDEKRMVMIAVGAVLAVTTVTLLAVTLTAVDEFNDDGGDGGDGGDEDKNYTAPLLLISLDGFRSDYIFQHVPTLRELADGGVMASFMIPTYPTLTFPNHYTIVTGLYPESHGIIANSFFDKEFDESFTQAENDGKFWGGEPIWNTITLQGKRSATYFWPGSDRNISGMFPTEWFMYDNSKPFTDRVDKVLEWLSSPIELRPDWVSLYFNEPDHTAHEYGPSSVEVDEKLAEMDAIIRRLLIGLKTKELLDQVNIMVVADHGMAWAGSEKVIDLTTYVSDITKLAYIYYGSFSRLRMTDSNSAQAVLEKLTPCTTNLMTMRAYTPAALPTRHHFANNKRIEDIVLDLDSGWTTSYNDWFLEGQHGYDNLISSMNALFIATGPAFKEGVRLEPFQNIELYNLMCYLTGVVPAPNNGTEGSLYHALKDPPPTPDNPEGDDPSEITFPPVLENLLNISGCPGDLDKVEPWLLTLNMTDEEMQDLDDFHLPWGTPQSASNLAAELVLLYHQDHVTGFSEKIRMPLWTSYTMEQLPEGSQENSTLWSSDVRLTKETTPTCASYQNLPSLWSMFPLFHPAFSSDKSLPQIPYLVSNAVPLPLNSSAYDTLDYTLKTLVPSTSDVDFSVNVMLGPVFDKDADSHPDNFTKFEDPEPPSDIFIIVTKCNDITVSFKNCQNDNLHVVAFILPLDQPVDNCLSPEQFAVEFSATVHDVELATGLIFYPALDFMNRTRLALRMPLMNWEGPGFP